MSKTLIPVEPQDIQLSTPLPYSVYDMNGILLLKKGFSVNLQRHLDVLIQNGAFLDEEEVVRARASDGRAEINSANFGALPRRKLDQKNPYEMIEVVKVRLHRIFDNFKHGLGLDEFTARIEGIGITVQEACTHDTDSVLASLHLEYELPYEVVHHLQAAVLCELVGKRLGVKDEARLTLVKAALTHDIGIIDLQDTLDHQLAPLTPQQKERIYAHPRDSAEALRKLGVADPEWLDPVRYHHERIDGSGYPEKLAGDAIGIPVRILAVADVYSAMIRDRPYRKAMISQAAMRELMIKQGNTTDQRLTKIMIKEIGVFPPGAIVRLVNGEIAVVKERQENSAYPIVYSFFKSSGTPMLEPIRRETVKAEFNVDGIVPFSQYRNCTNLICGLWHID